MEKAGFPPVMVQFHEVMGSPGEATDPSLSDVVVPKQGAVLLNAAVGNPPSAIVCESVSTHPLASVIMTV